MILGYSRYRYVEFTTDISTENVIKMHLNAFSFFGGFTDTILYDNMKQVVIERKLKASESRFNPKFMDFAEYYGIVIRLCYPYRPEIKWMQLHECHRTFFIEDCSTETLPYLIP